MYTETRDEDRRRATYYTRVAAAVRVLRRRRGAPARALEERVASRPPTSSPRLTVRAPRLPSLVLFARDSGVSSPGATSRFLLLIHSARRRREGDPLPPRGYARVRSRGRERTREVRLALVRRHELRRGRRDPLGERRGGHRRRRGRHLSLSLSSPSTSSSSPGGCSAARFPDRAREDAPEDPLAVASSVDPPRDAVVVAARVVLAATVFVVRLASSRSTIRSTAAHVSGRTSSGHADLARSRITSSTMVSAAKPRTGLVAAAIARTTSCISTLNSRGYDACARLFHRRGAPPSATRSAASTAACAARSERPRLAHSSASARGVHPLASTARGFAPPARRTITASSAFDRAARCNGVVSPRLPVSEPSSARSRSVPPPGHARARVEVTPRRRPRVRGTRRGASVCVL